MRRNTPCTHTKASRYFAGPRLNVANHFDQAMLGRPLRLIPCLGINLQSAPAIGVTHKLLHNLHVLSV
jgi:hypothetical protein